MRLLMVKFDTLYLWSSESDEAKQKILDRRATRGERIKSVGVEIVNGDMESPTATLTDEQFIKLTMLGEKMEIVGSNTPTFDRFESNNARLEAVVAKLETFGTSAGPGQFNEKVEVYTPGMGLMLFNRVMLLEDACSDALQMELDNGWKIIAACPQPNQRRPDYILGRYDPTHADNSGAGNRAERGQPQVDKESQ